MAKANKTSWKRLAPPSNRAPLGFAGFYFDERAERIIAGNVPVDMDDRWFIYSEDGWVYFHRSWTGACVFGVRLDGSPAGVRVIDSWVNRDPTQYTGANIDQDRTLLRNLIDRYFPEEEDAERKTAQPGATDNPDDAQRLREDH